MQTTQAPPQLPGVRAATLFHVSGIIYGALVLLVLALVTFVIGLTTVEANQTSGHLPWHLPWPLVQWVLSTPVGLVVLLAICVGVSASALFVVQRLILRGWWLARAVDVTEVPPWVWLTCPPVYWGETSADRWLGRSRRARRVSLTLLGGAALLFLLLVVSYLAVAVVSLGLIGQSTCGAHGCAPMYPLMLIVLASYWVAFGLSFFAQAHWLRRVEASSGVWLRYRSWFQIGGALCYIRQPGVTPEAAAVARARFAPPEPMPGARIFALAVLGVLPIFLLLIAGLFLQSWLPTQWLPG